MKKLQRIAALLSLLAAGFTSTSLAQVQSQLWQIDAQGNVTWDARLNDFTNVGYKGGAEPIPDWPVSVDVTNYGAIPNDGLDDSQAFMDAIAACANYGAVFVPKGRYVMSQRIQVERDFFVLRGEDMRETILFYPKYLSELYIEQVGWQGGGNTPKNTADGWFIEMTGREEAGIENLTMEFREQRKISPWEYIGANFLSISGTNCWARNLHLKNYDSGIRVEGSQHSIFNLIFDQFNGRQAVDNDINGKLDAYSAVLPRNLTDCLFHNISITGHLLQPIDINESSSNSVFSRISTGEGNNRVIGLHGGSTTNHLYTEFNRAVSRHDDIGDPKYGDFFGCTYWNINSSLSSDAYTAADNESIYVGYGNDWPFKSSATFYYEPAGVGQLTPENLYLAQLEYLNKPLPEDLIDLNPAPYELAGDVIRMVPSDDVTPGDAFDSALRPSAGAYFKFDLAQASEASVAKARLQFTLKGIFNGPFDVAAYAVNDDNWVETNLTSTNKPAVGIQLSSDTIVEGRRSLVVELDVTDFVRDELVGGDGVVSLYVDYPGSGGYLPPAWSTEEGKKPELIIERVADSVPGAPSAPKGVGSTPLVGNIVFDWEDNPESDVAYYNVYRSPSADGWLPQSGGLISSDHVDVTSIDDWKVGMMDYRQVYHYWFTAVDEHGYESEKSQEFVAAVIHPTNSAPAFGPAPLSLTNASSGAAYSEDITASASDLESDPMYFMKVSGPDWLNVALDGTLSGTPSLSDVGTVDVLIQVTAIGGSDQAVFSLTVEQGQAQSNPPTADAGADQTLTDADNSGSESVSLDGSGSTAVNDPIASYSWSEGGSEIATGLNPSVDLALGSHTITLTVTDAEGLTDTDTLEITVQAGAIPAGEVVGYYPFSGSTRLVSTDTAADSVAGDMVVGAGVASFNWETRGFWSPTQPSAAFDAGTDFADGVVLDDDYFAFTITPDAGIALDFTSLTFIDRSGGFSVSVATDQDGFTNVIDTVTAAGNWETNTLNLTSLSDVSGPVEIRLYFHDGNGNPRMIDNVTINANVVLPNVAPSADASTDQTVTDFNDDGIETVALDGSASLDSDGSIVSYVWSEGGSQVATGENPSVDLAVGLHTLTLTVTDNEGATATDTVAVTVEAAPPATVVAEYSYNALSLASTDTDTDTVAGDMVVGAGVTTFKWETRGFWSPTQPSAAFNAGVDFVDGVVLDDDYFSFTITPEAGVSLKPLSLSFIDRSGGFSVSVATDQDGFASVVDTATAPGSWGTSTLDLSSIASTTSAVEIRLYFHDGNGDPRMIDNVSIEAYLSASGAGGGSTPTNAAPTADAGADQTDTDMDGNGSQSVTLDGSGSSDADGSITSYVWSESGSQIATGVAPSVDLAVGFHTISLTVTDDAGASSTDTVEINVEAQPSIIPNAPTSQIPVNGTVSGSLASVTGSDNAYQTITEIDNGSTSILEHVWVFDVIGAEVATFYVEAHHSANTEGDNFVFAYSTDDVTYTEMLTVTKTSDDNTAQYYALPAGLSGTVYVMVQDTDTTAGNTQLDTLTIDELVIESETTSVAPSAATAPQPIDGAANVAVDATLSWTAGLYTASHEVYFGTNPSPGFQLNQAGTGFDPGPLLEDTTYYWSISEVNNSGTTAGAVWSFTTAQSLAPDVLHWTFDAGSGTTAADDSGNARDGTISGAVWTTDTPDGSAYALDFANGDFIEDVDAVNYLNGLSAITVAMWVQSDLTNTDNGFFSTNNPNGQDNQLAGRYDGDGWAGGGTNVIKSSISTTGGTSALESASNAQTTSWQHIAMTWSTGRSLKLYLDGVETTYTEAPASVSGTINNVATFVIGKGTKDGGGSKGWSGKIDDVRIYSRELLPAEVQALAQ
jgi:hypothetical protein